MKSTIDRSMHTDEPMLNEMKRETFSLPDDDMNRRGG
jgi:hypothetical protein